MLIDQTIYIIGRSPLWNLLPLDPSNIRVAGDFYQSILVPLEFAFFIRFCNVLLQVLSHDLLFVCGKTIDIAEGTNEVPNTLFIDLASPIVFPLLERQFVILSRDIRIECFLP
jgi:hypothetical protein